ncbi:Hypothetical predicted protein, partial [Marmota monax]
IMATIPMKGSRPQHQNRSPNYLPMQDYWVPKRDHRHQNTHRTFGHPPEQKSQTPLPHRTPSSSPHAGTPATTSIWTPINNVGLPQLPPSWDSPAIEIVSYLR